MGLGYFNDYHKDYLSVCCIAGNFDDYYEEYS